MGNDLYQWPSKRRPVQSGKSALLERGKTANVEYQLPDLVIAQFVKRGHAGTDRTVPDNPEKLAVRYRSHGAGTGKVARRRIEHTGHRSGAITT